MRRWHVMYTKPRSEMKVTQRLGEHGYEMYCPTIKTIRQWSDRKKKIEEPLFKSYIFAKILESERMELLKDPGVVNFVFWQGKPAILRESEVKAINNVTSLAKEVVIRGVEFKKGDIIQIPDGPFAGLSGIVDKMDKTRVIVYIEQLSCTVQFKYDIAVESK